MFNYLVSFPICKEVARCQVFITKQGNYLLDYYGKFLLQNDSVIYRYKKSTLKLLEYPFKTRCRYYRNDKMKSQNYCITKRLINEALTSGVDMPAQVPIFKGEAEAVSSKNIKMSPTYRRSSKCESKCSQISCQIEDYFVIEHSRRSAYENFIAIQILMPDRGELRVNYKAKIGV